jgi:peptidoglycan/xylan/chitin deacetylase (PgdA/CDA1 family)
MTARARAKRVVESVLRLAIGNPKRMAGRSLILAYHNVVPDDLAGRGDRSLHLPFSRFLAQLDLLQQHARVLPLAELLAEGPFADGPHIALTFDDAYRGAVDFALPELARRGLPATLFIAPGLLGFRSFWWDALAIPGRGLPDAARREGLSTFAGRHEQICDEMGQCSGPDALPQCYGCATAQDIRALGALRQLTLGAHSWSHPNLARITDAELAAELSRPLDWLRATGMSVVPFLALPYGISSPVVELAARHAGYTASLLVDGGWIAPRTGKERSIPRYNVPAGLSSDGLQLRLSGYLAA